MKHPVIAMMLNPGKMQIDGQEFPIKLPDGCMGLLFMFESKKAARKYWGKDVPFMRAEKVIEDKEG